MWTDPGRTIHSDFSLTNYRNFTTSAYFHRLLWGSVKLTLWVTAGTLLLGYPAVAYSTARSTNVDLDDQITRMLNGQRVFATPATTDSAPAADTTGQPAEAPDEAAALADTAELLHRRQPTEDHPVADLDMPA